MGGIPVEAPLDTILINSHGITPNHTEAINMVNEYSVFFRVLP